VLGSRGFGERLETTLGRRVTRLPHGGDRRTVLFRINNSDPLI
jgi:hypothetical protein